MNGTQPPGSPPAIWTAFARASNWKSWVIAFQLSVIALLVLANLRLGRREADVVVISPEGQSTYLPRSVAGDALLNFLAEQKGQPPDVAVVHFTVEFLKRFLGLNSSTIREAWPEALAQMAPGLREKLQREAEAQKLVPMLEAAEVRTEIAVEDVTLVERTSSLLHVRAVLRRTKSRLPHGEAPATDAVRMDFGREDRAPERGKTGRAGDPGGAARGCNSRRASQREPFTLTARTLRSAISCAPCGPGIRKQPARASSASACSSKASPRLTDLVLN